MLIRVTRNFVTKDIKVNHQQFVHERAPSDLEQLEYFRNEFPALRIAQIFQIFQILNKREAPQQQQFQKLQLQIRNRYRNIMSAQIIQNQTRTRLQEVQTTLDLVNNLMLQEEVTLDRQWT